jgi:hypothetical protein
MTERGNTQFRVEMFNVFNRVNLAPAGAPFTGERWHYRLDDRIVLRCPGIGPGEPFNVQFALKVLF